MPSQQAPKLPRIADVKWDYSVRSWFVSLKLYVICAVDVLTRKSVLPSIQQRMRSVPAGWLLGNYSAAVVHAWVTAPLDKSRILTRAG